MANWNLSYGLNIRGGGSDRLKCQLTDKGGNGIQLIMGGEIPEGPVGAEDAIKMVKEKVPGLDGLDANDPASHVRYLRTIAAFSTELADAIEGN